MAYDKVVDSAKLDADLTAIGDKIRKEIGIPDDAGVTFPFPEGMAQGVSLACENAYSNGYGKAKGEDLLANKQILAECNTALIEKGVETASTLEQVPTRIGEIEVGSGAGYDEGYAEGKQAERSEFIARYQEYGNRKDYTRTWSGTAWDDETFTPIYDMQPTACTSMFEGSKITNLKAILERCGVTLDFSKVTYGQATYLFRDSDITDVGIIDLSGYTSYNYVLNNAKKLVNVEKVILREDGSTKLGTAMFTGVPALVEIRFEGTIACSVDISSASNLSNASVDSFVVHYADMTGQTAPTFKVHRNVEANMTADQKAMLTAKNVTLVTN